MERKFVADDERKAGHTHVILITTGSVASIKAPLIVSELLTVRMLRHFSQTTVYVLMRLFNSTGM